MNISVTDLPLEPSSLNDCATPAVRNWDCADNMPRQPFLKPHAPDRKTTFVRHAALCDLDAICQFIADLAIEEGYDSAELKLTQADLKDALFGLDPLAFAYVAEHEGETVGFALCYRTFSTLLGKPGMHLDDLYIAPPQRGLGLGTALLALIEEDTAQKNFARLEWWVLESNTAAQAFYRKLGAARVPEVHVYRMSHTHAQ